MSVSIALSETVLPLAESGRSDYRIVIRENASPLDRHAADELAHFIEQASGYRLPIVTDDTEALPHEIVLGNTNRLPVDTLPADFQPQGNDGFTVYPFDQKLLIVGTVDRGTLYGVYDFLEQEVGIRFLNPDVTHVPEKSSLQVAVAPRRFTPAFEYRNLLYSEPEWGLRSRLNGSDGIKAVDRHLGGAIFVGPKFVHTFGLLVPADTYFASHPEYYALIKGTRQPATAEGLYGQLCLSHPEVQKILLQTTRTWLNEYKQTAWRYDPDELMIVSVSANDNEHVCECDRCAAINQEEASPGGTLYRTINFIAESIEQEYPTARIETLAYGPSEQPPVKTKPHKNVIIRFAPIGSNFFEPFDDAVSDANLSLATRLSKWQQIAPSIYIWNYHTNFHSNFRPFPDLKYLGDNIRYLRTKGLKGYFSESSLSRRAAFQDLRNYILARTIWRPELDSRELLEEYCRLGYGAAGDLVLEYIDTIHANVVSQQKALYWNDASISDGIRYDYPFLLKLDDILARAIETADDETARRITLEHRLGVWYQIIEAGLTGEVGRSRTLPIEWQFRMDPSDAGLSDNWQKAEQFDGWVPIRVDSAWTAQGHDYHGVAWYTLAFDITDEEAGNIDAIQFGAVDGRYDLFLDGKRLHRRYSDPGTTWNVPFVVKLPQPLSPGTHRLTMRVQKEAHAAGIWKPVLLKDARAGLPDEVVRAAEAFLEIAPNDEILTSLAAYHGPRGETIADFAARVKGMLQLNNASSGLPAGTVIQPAALLINGHNTFEVIGDDTTPAGQVAVQLADREWSLGQSIQWIINERLKQAHERGEKIVLKVRVKLDRDHAAGTVFHFGYANYNDDWSAQVLEERAVRADETAGTEWQWFTLKSPLRFVPSDRGTIAYIRAANSAGSIGKIYVDSFVIEPQ